MARTLFMFIQTSSICCVKGKSRLGRGWSPRYQSTVVDRRLAHLDKIFPHILVLVLWSLVPLMTLYAGSQCQLTLTLMEGQEKAINDSAQRNMLAFAEIPIAINGATLNSRSVNVTRQGEIGKDAAVDKPNHGMTTGTVLKNLVATRTIVWLKDIEAAHETNPNHSSSPNNYQNFYPNSYSPSQSHPTLDGWYPYSPPSPSCYTVSPMNLVYYGYVARTPAPFYYV
ncbi:hypothetical protein K449DRAFT_468463 [Hypoxylon sp. EC38]|nr:hypothetical protein K449DRAFT_468463 [Hypoxylon sp. EC38]